MTSSTVRFRVPRSGELDEVLLNEVGGVAAEDHRYDFFVSYVSADEKWANWIAWQLEGQLRIEGRAPKVFVRAWDIVAGSHEYASIHRALAASDRLVAVLTSAYLVGGVEEFTTMWSRDRPSSNRRLLPVMVEPCNPDGLLASIRPIDLCGLDSASAIDTLLARLNESLGGRAKPASAPAFPALGQPVEDQAVGPPFPGPPVLVGEPPTVPPRWFQDRDVEVEDLERHLGDARTGLVTLVGREGLGKTAMAHRIWERMRAGPPHVHGLVYLSAHGFRPVTAESVIDGLTALFPTHQAKRLEAEVRRPLPWVERLALLLDALGGRRVIIAIDAIEELLDDNQDLADTALRELVDYLLSRPEHGVRLFLVGRSAPDAVAQRFPGASHVRNLRNGLPCDETFALLQVMDARDRLSLGEVSDHDKARLHRQTEGSPRAVELAYGVLSEQDISVTQLLAFMEQRRTDGAGIVVHLLERAYERLSSSEQLVLQALAIYGRPVKPAAVDHLLGDALPDLDCRAVLDRLRRLRLARWDGECFSVAANDERDHLVDLLRRECGSRADRAPEALLHRAADYFAGERRRDAVRLADVRPQLVEIELRLRAGAHEAAFKLMETLDDEYLFRWGSSSALFLSLEKVLRARGMPRKLKIDAASLLARALMQQQDYRSAANHLSRAIELASGVRLARRRIVLREQLSVAYLRLGDVRRATYHSRRACLAAAAQVRTRDATTALAGLAMCLAGDGRFPQALRLLAVARRMLRRYGTARDQVQLPTMLLDEAWVRGQLGERDRAQSRFEEGRRRADALGDQRLIGRSLLGEAQLALDKNRSSRDPNQLVRAVTLAEKASEIGVRHGNRPLCRLAMEILAIARLGQDKCDAAARAADIAQRNRGSVLGFALVGLAAYRLERWEDARAAFRSGDREARRRYRDNERDFQILDAHGLAATGLALLGEPSSLGTALTAYGEVREITTAAGAVERSLLLLEQFGPRADSSILERVCAVAKGERRGPWA